MLTSQGWRLMMQAGLLLKRAAGRGGATTRRWDTVPALQYDAGMAGK